MTRLCEFEEYFYEMKAIIVIIGFYVVLFLTPNIEKRDMQARSNWLTKKINRFVFSISYNYYYDYCSFSCTRIFLILFFLGFEGISTGIYRLGSLVFLTLISHKSVFTINPLFRSKRSTNPIPKHQMKSKI